MGNFFDNLRAKLQTFMIGRNGPDKLSTAALIASVVLIIVNTFIPSVVLTMLSYALLFYCVYRMFSRNVVARQQENAKFENFLGKFSGKGGKGSAGKQGKGGKGSAGKQGKGGFGGFGKQQNKDAGQAGAKGNTIPAKMSFKCENCGQSLSVPSGKGTLKVTCPKCHHQQQVKS